MLFTIETVPFRMQWTRPGIPEVAFPLEYQRVEPGIREPGIDNIHPLEAGDRSQKKPVIQDHQISAFHQRYPHSPGQKSVFRVNGTLYSGSKQDHGRSGPLRDRSQPEEEYRSVYRQSIPPVGSETAPAKRAPVDAGSGSCKKGPMRD